MGKKRILHITSSLQMGGAEQILFHLIRLLNNDFEHVVICFHKGPFVEKIRELGVPVYHIHGYFRQYDPTFLIRLYRLIKTLNPDLIHTVLWFAGVLGRIIGRLSHKPVICAIHSPLNTNKEMSPIRSWVDRLTIQWASHIIFVAKNVQNNYRKYLLSYKTTLIENGIDYHWLHVRSQKRSIPKSSDHFIIGTVGRLVTIKNQQLLLNLIKRLQPQFPHVRLLIIGHGPLHNQLVQKAYDLGIQEKITIIADEATFYYSLFDIFVLPSFAEGLSMALLEAMSFSIPVLVAHWHRNHEVIVEGCNGYLFNPYNLDQLERRVIGLIMDKYARIQVGKAALNTIRRRFSMNKVVQKYRKLYEETASL